MNSLTRLLAVLLAALWLGQGLAATTDSGRSKTSAKSASPSSKAKSKAKASTTTADEKSAAQAEEEPAKKPTSEPAKTAVQETDKEPPAAAVSTVSIEDISGFDQYPKQVQSLVQSALALTHLELRYLYGSHEPAKGGMDCSGTIYHILRFQGLKDVPRQSDEMALWVDKKALLHLTPTATAFDSPEFSDLKPGDLLFWTNTTETTRKLPVTHVMVYLGKLKGSGKRIIFGASDGRSFAGHRRSGVSVFDFNLPRVDGVARLYGYGAAPGLLPEPPPQKPEVPLAVAPVDKPTAGAAAASSHAESKKAPAKNTVAVDEPAATGKAAAPKGKVAQEEVRKAVAVTVEEKPATPMLEDEPENPAPTAEPTVAPGDGAKKEDAKVAATAPTVKPKTTTQSGSSTKKKSAPVSMKRRTPQPPPKTSVERALDNAVNSVRRIFR